MELVYSSADLAGLLCPVHSGKPSEFLSAQPDSEKGGYFLPTEQTHLWRRKPRDLSSPDPWLPRATAMVFSRRPVEVDGTATSYS